MLSRKGDAAGVLTEAELWIKSDPLHADEAHAFTAEALLALGRPVGAVEEAIRQRTRRLPEERSRTKLYWERALAELRGDFPAAEQALKEQRDFAKENSLERRDHAAAALAMVQFYAETGRDADAAAVAKDFLGKQEAWAPDRSAPHLALIIDPVPRLLVAERHAKVITKADYEAALAAWVSGWQARLAPRFSPDIWLVGYAAVADTRELAVEALAARAKLVSDGDPAWGSFDKEAALGRVYAMAGDYERARPHLEKAIHALWTLHAVIEATQIEALYGESLEKSDPPRACEAYANVLRRWGNAKGSLTAAKAAARAKQMKCDASK